MYDEIYDTYGFIRTNWINAINPNICSQTQVSRKVNIQYFCVEVKPKV